MHIVVRLSMWVHTAYVFTHIIVRQCYMQFLYTFVYICEAVCWCATYYVGICWSMFLHMQIASNAEVVYVMYVGWVYMWVNANQGDSCLCSQGGVRPVTVCPAS